VPGAPGTPARSGFGLASSFPGRRRPPAATVPWGLSAILRMIFLPLAMEPGTVNQGAVPGRPRQRADAGATPCVTEDVTR